MAEHGSNNSKITHIHKHFLPQDVDFTIHLSDNWLITHPLATTVVSPPRKWALWVETSTPQSTSASFCEMPVLCLCLVQSVIEQLALYVDGIIVKWVRRIVVELLLNIYWHSNGQVHPLILALDGLVKRRNTPAVPSVGIFLIIDPIKRQRWDTISPMLALYQTDPRPAVSCFNSLRPSDAYVRR